METIKRILPRDKELMTLVLISLAVTFVLSQMLGRRLFSIGAVQGMSIQISEFGFLALAMALAMLTAGIDLSIVAAAGLAGVMSSMVMGGQLIPVTPGNQGMLLVLGIVTALLTGLLTGLLNGLIIAKLSMPPILATLGTMILYTGIGMAITSGNSVPIRVAGFSDIAKAAIGPLPAVFILLLLAFGAVAFVLSRTKFGRRVYLFGENEVALRFSGVKSERVTIMTYALIGLLVGFAAIIMISRANSMRVGFGETYLLQAILVVVLAGFSPFGGKGRVASLAIGLFLLQILSSAMTAFAFSPYAKNLAWGAILLVVMAANHHVRTFRPKPKKQLPPAPAAPDPAAKAALMHGV